MKKRAFSLVLILSLLLLGLIPSSLLAQDGEGPVLVEVTEEPSGDVVTETPTEEPVDEVTETPTEEPTEEPVDEVTETPTEEPVDEVPTETPTEAPVGTPPTPTDSAFADDFENGLGSNWALTGDWGLLALETGNALGSSSPGSTASINGVTWGSYLLSIRTRVSADGALAVDVGAGVQVQIDGNGFVSLIQDGLVLSTTQSRPVQPGQWADINIQVFDDNVTVAVQRTVELTYAIDTAATGLVLVNIAGSVAVDDVAINNLDDAVVPPPPTDAPVIEATPEQTMLASGFGLNPMIEQANFSKAEAQRFTGLSSTFAQIITAPGGRAFAAQELAAQSAVRLEGNRVWATVIASDISTVEAVKAALPGLGAEITADFEIWIDAWIPLDKLENVAALPGVNSIQPVIEAFIIGDTSNDPPAQVDPSPATGAADFAFTGVNVTEGVKRSGANQWHRYGWEGQGVHVGVLDSFAFYTSAQAAGELPPGIGTLGTLNLGSPHGTAVAEIIYDMAPDVQFTFSSPNSAVDMANKIVQLASSGVDIISSSMGFYSSEAGDGVGPVSTAINTAHATYGTIYVQAAGNQAQYNYQAAFADANSNGYHEFAPGWEVNCFNRCKPLPGNWNIFLFLRWSAWNAARNGNVGNVDYDLRLHRWNGASWVTVASSLGNQGGSLAIPPIEEIGFGAAGGQIYGFSIQRWSGSTNVVLDIMGHNAPPFNFGSKDRSLVDPATAFYSFAVAALDAGAPRLEPYSSQGPALSSGGYLAIGNQQPRISGYANVSTWAYGRRAPRQYSFNGTSAATPHVSGAAALVLSAFPGFTPNDVWNFLESRAVDMGARGYDFVYGSGRLSLGRSPRYPRVNLVSPPRRALTNFNSAMLIWDPSSFGGAAPVYEVNLANNPRFLTPAIGYTASINIFASGLADGRYYWRVRPWNANAADVWSKPFFFTVDTIPPGQTIVLRPFVGEVYPWTKAFTWRRPATAYSFQIQIDNNSNFSSPEVNVSGIRTTSYKLPVPLTPGVYYWRVRAFDLAGNVGDWSIAQSFTAP